MRDTRDRRILHPRLGRQHGERGPLVLDPRIRMAQHQREGDDGHKQAGADAGRDLHRERREQLLHDDFLRFRAGRRQASTQDEPFQTFSGFSTQDEPFQTFTGFSTQAEPFQTLILPVEAPPAVV